MQDDVRVQLPATTSADLRPVTMNDAMSPRALFAAATQQFSATLHILDGSMMFAPNVLGTQQAVRHAERGVNTLRSVLLPSVPFATRQLAAAAIDRAKESIAHLVDYQQHTRAAFGNFAVPRSQMTADQRTALEAAIDSLLSATGKLA